MRVIKSLLFALSCLRLPLHCLVFLFAPRLKSAHSDVERWIEATALDVEGKRPSPLHAFVHFMTFYPEFRNQFYLRCGTLKIILLPFCPPMPTLKLNIGHCGDRLFIQHGDSTLISADSIGDNCWINQQVVIGYANDRIHRPSIGNNVIISAGAKILGNVKIGDNARVGANTVVLADVPANVTVLGVPAKIVFGAPADRR